jgi:hypothetical protein
MEQTMGSRMESLFDTRALLAVLVLVAGVTGSNLWIHRGDPPLGYARYDGYGFTVDYSQRMSIFDGNLGGYGQPTEESGMMQARMPGEGLEQFGVIWMRPEGISSSLDRTPEGALEQLFGSIGLGGTKIGGRGELMAMTKDGHDMVYQTFTLEESGFNIPAIIGSWYCEESGKFLMLYLIYVPHVSQPEMVSPEMESVWLGYLESLTCH